MADDPDGWARSVGERVGARVVSSPFEAELVVTHRLETAEARGQRRRLAEVRQLQAVINPVAPAAGPLEAPGSPAATPAAPVAPVERPAELDRAIERVRAQSVALADARREQDAARARVAQAAQEAETARRLQASMEAAPTELREAGATVLHASEQARALKEALGARPVYDPTAHARINEVQAELDDATDHHEFLRRRVGPVLAIALGLTLVAVSARLKPAAIAAIVVVLAVALAMLFRRVLATRRRARTTRQTLEGSLAEAGVERVDQLEQRQIEMESWERRATEAASADDAWAEATQRWQTLAGPEADPHKVEELIADFERARQVTDRLSADRTAHDIADQGVGRLEDDWRHLMSELGLDGVPPSEPTRALEALESRARPSVGAAPPPPPAVAPGPAVIGAALDPAVARARLAEVLGGLTIEELQADVERLGGMKPADDRPLLLADPLRNVAGSRKRALLGEFERLSKLEPVVLVTADPEVQSWAASR